MASLLEQFEERWNARHESGGFIIDPENDKILVMTPMSEEVGPLRVHDDVEELTVEIGRIFHSHFSWYSYSTDEKSEGLSLAINAAIDFVERVTQDQYIFEVQYSKDEIVSVTCFLENEYDGEDSETLAPFKPPSPITSAKKYRWSGPID